MTNTTNTVSECKCLRCDHKWMPRKPGRPIVCPECNSPRWDKPKKDEKAA